MKDSKDAARSPSKQDFERDNEKFANGKKHTGKSSKLMPGAFMAALTQGVIPQIQGEELLEGLSQIGNYAFLQAVERKGNRDKALTGYVNKEVISPKAFNRIMGYMGKSVSEPLEDSTVENGVKG